MARLCLLALLAPALAIMVACGGGSSHPTPFPLPTSTAESTASPPQHIAPQTSEAANSSRVSGPHVRSIGLVTSLEGWALMSGGLSITNDGGESWLDVTPPGVAAASIKGAFFLDSDHGWVAASGMQDAAGATQLLVLRTDDGGKTWLPAPIGSPAKDYTLSFGIPAYIDFLDESNGWVVVRLISGSQFSVGELYRTADGGVTWTKLSIPLGESVRFVTPTDGWVAGGPAGDKLYVTRDGGASWEAQPIAPPSAFKSGYPIYRLPLFADKDHGLLPVAFAGDPSGFALYATSDGGHTWQAAGERLSPDPLAIGAAVPGEVLDLSTWVVQTSVGRQLRLMPDGSPTLSSMETASVSPGVFFLDFANKDVGWGLQFIANCTGFKSCTSRNALVATYDGGETWKELDPTPEAP